MRIGIIALCIIITVVLGCKKTGYTAEKQVENQVTLEPQEKTKPLETVSLAPGSPLHTQLGLMQADIPKTEFPLIDVQIQDLAGKQHMLSEYKGKVIMLNLWATWCPPCRSEMPDMDELYKAYKDKGFMLAAVSVGEEKKTVTDFLKQNPYSFPVFLDTAEQVSANYGTGSIPTTYLIDKKGFLIGRFVGARPWNSQEARKLIEMMLNQ